LAAGGFDSASPQHVSGDAAAAAAAAAEKQQVLPPAAEFAPLLSDDSDNEMDGGMDAGSDSDRTDVEPSAPRQQPVTPRTPRTPGAAALAAAGDALGGMQLALDAENEYGWFKSEKLGAWAGPTHWKFRRTQGTGVSSHSLSLVNRVAHLCFFRSFCTEAEAVAKEKAGKTRTRKPKEAFKIDFNAPLDLAALLKRTRKIKTISGEKVGVDYGSTRRST
jgi:hypothetical protein